MYENAHLNNVIKELTKRNEIYLVNYLTLLKETISTTDQQYTQFYFKMYVSDIPQEYTTEYYRREAQVKYLESLKDTKINELENIVEILYAAYCC